MKFIVRFITILFTCMLLAAVPGFAEDFTEATSLIAAKTPCSQLTQDQLEKIGDYYMEQMHPGSQHEAMEEAMGGEGSGTVKAVHISMAQRLYCNDYASAASYGMYGMMNTGGMMNGWGNGMMNNGLSWINQLTWILFMILVWVATGWLIFWLIAKSRKNEKRKRK